MKKNKVLKIKNEFPSQTLCILSILSEEVTDNIPFFFLDERLFLLEMDTLFIPCQQHLSHLLVGNGALWSDFNFLFLYKFT